MPAAFSDSHLTLYVVHGRTRAVVIKHIFYGLSSHQETQMCLHFLMQPLFAEKKSEVVFKIHQRVKFYQHISQSNYSTPFNLHLHWWMITFFCMKLQHFCVIYECWTSSVHWAPSGELHWSYPHTFTFGLAIFRW